MEDFKELLEYILACREEKMEGFKIVDALAEEFDYLIEREGGEYFGIQLDGKAIHITYYTKEHRMKVGAMVSLEDV